MDYINGKMAGALDVRVKADRTIDCRRYLSEMTWEELEKYWKSIKKKRK